MSIGIFGSSLKTGEKRIPLHPKHLVKLPKDQLKQCFFEERYGEDFGFDINTLKKYIAGIKPREALFKQCQTILLPKICDADLPFLQPNQIIYGWPHCVQGENITQTAINKSLTLVAFEAMFSLDAKENSHIFYRNNELAGIASIHHALQMHGITGYYGYDIKALVFGSGSTARGAILGLKSQGINQITVLTSRKIDNISDKDPDIEYIQYSSKNQSIIPPSSLESHLKSADIIVNCMLQDPTKPLMIINNTDNYVLKDQSLVIDISCDEDIGFCFAKPTSIEDPLIKIPKYNTHYYAVDHSPSIYWQNSSYEISKALLPFIDHMLKGEQGYKENKILQKAVEIEKGQILNDKIRQFQNL